MARPIVIGEDEFEYVRRYIADRCQRNGDCIEWTGSQNGGGRGVAHLPRRGAPRRSMYAYRLVWTVYQGPIPDGLEICHHCDNPLCVNVKHLFLGTHQENMADMGRKGRYPKERRRLGVKHHKAKHDDELIQRVVAAWESGRYLTYGALGREYGVHRATVRSWVTGLTRTAKPVPVHVCRLDFVAAQGDSWEVRA
ncbi:MAG: HNH endonuclease [Actinomycetota bacterium]|nr:HNH endonuclease [Actinomycetota bacterium]